MSKYALIETDYVEGCGGDCHPDFTCYTAGGQFKTEKELSEHFAQNGYLLLELLDDPSLEEELAREDEHSGIVPLEDLCEEIFKGQEPAPRPTKFLSAIVISMNNIHQLQQDTDPTDFSGDLIALGKTSGKAKEMTYSESVLLF